jgi:hypothetical protein
MTNKQHQNDHHIWSTLSKNKHERKKGGADEKREKSGKEEKFNFGFTIHESKRNKRSCS